MGGSLKTTSENKIVFKTKKKPQKILRVCGDPELP